MEISFDSRTKTIYREISHQVRRVQDCAESVVPDVNDDIGKIASVQTSVFLKSKDVTGRGVTVGGELTAALIYITENENGVSFVNLTKTFSIEYEVPDMDAETLAHIALSVSNVEARVLNPRKVSVAFELAGELSCYRRGEVKVETLLPAQNAGGLHARYESAQANFANAVCEKTFTLSEQYSFPTGKPAAARLVSETASFSVTDTQLIGTKLVLKGSVSISVFYLSDEVNYPLRTEFTSAFSQIIETGTDNMESCTATVAVTSAFYELNESVSGDMALAAELHAVVQLVSRSRETVKYISDIYSNLMPVEFSAQSSQLRVLSETKRLIISNDDRISVADDCADVLSVCAGIAHFTVQQSRLSAAVTLDIVYRTKGGGLSAARRLEDLEGEFDGAASRLLGLRLSDVYLRPDGPFIDSHISAEAEYQSADTVELFRIEAAALADDAPYDPGKFPTMTLVRAGDESLWELAKTFHSSVERIAAMNELGGELRGKLLLIPKAE